MPNLSSPPELTIICPNCEEQISYINYHIATVGTAYGHVDLSNVRRIRRFYTSDITPTFREADHEYDDSSDSDTDGDYEYYCPECSDPIDTDILNAFTRENGQIQTLSRQEIADRQVVFGQSTETQNLHTGGSGRTITLAENIENRTTNLKIITCPSCNKETTDLTTSGCCLSCGAEL
jgi:hypothetical protein